MVSQGFVHTEALVSEDASWGAWPQSTTDVPSWLFHQLDNWLFDSSADVIGWPLSLCVCVYACLCARMCACVCMHVCVCASMHVRACLHACVSVCACIWVRACVCMYVSARVCVRTCVCMHVCMCELTIAFVHLTYLTSNKTCTFYVTIDFCQHLITSHFFNNCKW